MPRQRFFFNLGALGGAFLLIVAAVALGPGGVKGVGLGIGIACCVASFVFAAALAHERRLLGHQRVHIFGHALSAWSALAGAVASVAIWEIVEAAVFKPAVSRWLTLANGIVVGALACGGLVAHEISSERVIHVLEVVERSDRNAG